MKRMILLLCAACALLVVLAACSDSTNPPTQSPTISGVLTDTGGNPVADAAVIVDLDLAEVTMTTADKPQTMVTFDVPDSVAFEFWISDACDDEVFYQLSVPAGSEHNAVIWNGRDQEGLKVPEGMYHFHAQAPDREPQVFKAMVAYNLDAESGDFAVTRCDSVRQTWRVAAWTDANGRFTIAKDCWSFGRSFDATDETGEVTGQMVVTSQVRLWFYPEGRYHGFASDWGTFNDVTGASIAVTMPPEVFPAR